MPRKGGNRRFIIWHTNIFTFLSLRTTACLCPRAQLQSILYVSRAHHPRPGNVLLPILARLSPTLPSFTRAPAFIPGIHQSTLVTLPVGGNFFIFTNHRLYIRSIAPSPMTAWFTTPATLWIVKLSALWTQPWLVFFLFKGWLVANAGVNFWPVCNILSLSISPSHAWLGTSSYASTVLFTTHITLPTLGFSVWLSLKLC